jgi:hypothetical protein
LDGIELQAQRLAVAQFHGLKEVVLDLDLDFAETPACLEPVADDGPIAPVDDFQGLGPHPLKDLRQSRDVTPYAVVTVVRHVVRLADPGTELDIAFTERHPAFSIQPTQRITGARTE